MDGYAATQAIRRWKQDQGRDPDPDLVPTDLESLRTEIQRMLNRRVELILATGPSAALRAKKIVRGTDVPVGFAPVYDPVKSGLARSMVKPGRLVLGSHVGEMSREAQTIAGKTDCKLMSRSDLTE